MSPGLRKIAQRLLDCPPKTIVLSGPSGFLGKKVLDSILDVHAIRMEHKEDPGEVILLSSSPGNMMQRLEKGYGAEKMKTIKASRVDYYNQHDVDTWRNHLGSLGAEGEHAVFVNLAAVAGPVKGRADAMRDVNYVAPLAAASACRDLGFGHWVQSSTQATNAERAGQVPYSKWKAMLDYALAHMDGLPSTIACLGLLYSRTDGLIGQSRSDASLNLIDLALLPLTPIMGDGSAPLQPQEVTDAADRLVYLALTDPQLRPLQPLHARQAFNPKCQKTQVVRYYDAVGPETISTVDMLHQFAEYQGNSSFRPVFIDYRNMEHVLNVKSLGNLNRQFVSLLRSEQSADTPIIGDPTTWSALMGQESRLLTLAEAFDKEVLKQQEPTLADRILGSRRRFPYLNTLKWAFKNPRVIPPGIMLSLEIVLSFAANPRCRQPASPFRSTLKGLKD